MPDFDEVRRLSESGYILLAQDADKKWTILEDTEGHKEEWGRYDTALGKLPTEKGVIMIWGRAYEYQRALNTAEALKLVRRWEGISPDEDAADEALAPEQEVEAPPPPKPLKVWPPTELDILRMMETLAGQSGVKITDDNRGHFTQRAITRLEAMYRAPTLNVPELPPAIEVNIGGRDRETGEWKVTHAYHDLYAPEGETVTRQMTDEQHMELGRYIRDLVVEGHNTQEVLDKLLAHKIQAGQVWSWDRVVAQARERLSVVMPIGELIDAGDTIDAVCYVMVQEQLNHPQHEWKLDWPNVVCLAPGPEGPSLCDHKLGGRLWILPIRFKQCGPVPFGPMCERCVKVFGEMGDDDPRLVPPEQRNPLGLATDPEARGGAMLDTPENRQKLCEALGLPPIGAKTYSTDPGNFEPFGSELVYCRDCKWDGMHRHASRAGSKERGWKSACPECGSLGLHYVDNGNAVQDERWPDNNTNSKEAVNGNENPASGEDADVEAGS